MKYIIFCNLTEKSIKELKYCEGLNLKSFKSLKQLHNFCIPLVSFNIESYSKIKMQISKKLSKLQTFRINIDSVKKDTNKHLYLLIEQKGFLNTIKRTFEEELCKIENTNFEILTKYDSFYIDFMFSNSNNTNINKLLYPKFLKVHSIEIMKLSYKKHNLIDLVNLKSI